MFIVCESLLQCVFYTSLKHKQGNIFGNYILNCIVFGSLTKFTVIIAFSSEKSIISYLIGYMADTFLVKVN